MFLSRISIYGITKRNLNYPPWIGGPPTAKALDALALAMPPIADERMDVGISDAVIGTGVVRTGKAVCGDTFRSAASALELPPGANGCRWPRCAWREGDLPTPSRAIVGRTRFQQPLARSGSLVWLELMLMVPTVDQPEPAEDQYTDQRADQSGHQSSLFQPAIRLR